MQEILINGGQFVGQNGIEQPDDRLVALHVKPRSEILEPGCRAN
jgi:hypothetical protein